jgi:excisionase family DNA binding protein
VEDRLLYRVTEVAVFLNVSRSKVYELLASGDLRSVKIDRTRWSAAPTSATTSSRFGPSPEPSHSVRRYAHDQLIRSDLPVIRVRASRFF